MENDARPKVTDSECMKSLFFFLKAKTLYFEETFRPLFWAFNFFYRILNLLYGASISYRAKISGVPLLPHNVSGIFISEKAIIGKNCTIFHNVTIGSIERNGETFAPIIGDNALIGAGAIIIGNIRLGNNVRIGAGAIIARDIPDNCTAILDALRIIENK
jgi:serine acetyltransferase